MIILAVKIICSCVNRVKDFKNIVIGMNKITFTCALTLYYPIKMENKSHPENSELAKSDIIII